MLATLMPVLATSSMSTLNLRYSRRSACDRCRAYKLRCQRDERLGKPCERCAKSRLACTTTFDPASTSTSSSAASSSTSQAQRLNAAAQAQAQAQQQQQQQQQNNNGQIQVGAREHQTLLPSPEQLHSPPDQRGRRPSTFAPLANQGHLSHSPAGQREHDDSRFQRPGEPLLCSSLSDKSTQQSLPRSASDTASMERNDNTGGENMLLDPNPLGLDPMDFSLPDMAFDANELSLLMVDHSPTRAEPGSRQSGGDDGSGVFGHEDDATLCGPGPGTNLGWPSHGGHVEPCLDAGRDGREFEPDTMGGPADTQRFTSSYKDLLKLSLELVEDREILDTQAPLTSRPSIAPLTCSSTQQQQPVNRVLNQTARFWDIVKAMSSSSPELTANYANGGGSSSSGSGGSGSQSRSNSTSSSVSLINLNNLRHGWANASLNGNGDLDSSSSASSSSSRPISTPGRQDHLLMINLVMTYVNLLRNCRAVFTRLYHALQVTPSPESNAMLSLPSLQFGEFQLENNVTIQVKVLIELTSGMLQRIGNALGINTGTGSGISSSPDDRNYRLPFLNDPVAVSTREIILSQESMQGGVHGGEPPLMDIMSNLKRLLERR